MLDIKMNFKNKYKSDLSCKICKEDGETLDHIFQCRVYKDKLKFEKDFTHGSMEMRWKKLTKQLK